MRPFLDWFQQHIRPDEPWLILGKGPSFGLREKYDLAGYRLLSLNHAVREQSVLVAHLIDLDVLEVCGDTLERQAGVLVMPWYPHVANQPGSQSLETLVASVPVLRRLDAEDRLLWYDLSTAPVRYGTAPVVQATYFSAEAALDLLALAGARRIRTLGVDGGTSYSTDFNDLRDRTLLANGRTNFDLQFQGFAGTILRTGVDVAPLDAPSPVRVYVGHTPAEALALAVLRFSIRKRASLSTEVVPLSTDGPSLPGEDDRALVMAPRVQCLSDVRPLWLGPVDRDEVLLPGGPPPSGSRAMALALVGPNSRSNASVMAMLAHRGCLPEALPEPLSTRARFRLDPGWQPTPRYRRGQTRAVYYANDGSEPWLSRTHPLGHVWMQDLLEAVATGFISPELVTNEIGRGHVRPSLAYQVEHHLLEAILLPRRARLLDRGFRPPEGERIGAGSPVGRWLTLPQALAREAERYAREYRRRRPSRQSTARIGPQPERPAEPRGWEARRPGIAAQK